jgi:hypothetical protein
VSGESKFSFAKGVGVQFFQNLLTFPLFSWERKIKFLCERRWFSFLKSPHLFFLLKFFLNNFMSGILSSVTFFKSFF